MNLLKEDCALITYFNYTKRDGLFRMADGDRPLAVLDLTFCIEGEMHYIYNGKHIRLHSGDGIFMCPGSFRERFETNVPTLYASFNLIVGFDMEFEIDGYLPNIVNSNTLYLLDMFKKDFATVSPYRDQKCLSTFNYIYNQICETLCNTENPHVKAIKQYISENLAGNLSLSILSEQVHLAPQYICALFKKETGMTITQYILKTRIDAAKMMIIATNDTIFKIAEHCGFTDYCYFSHVFKKFTGVSARQYRSNLMK